MYPYIFIGVLLTGVICDEDNETLYLEEEYKCSLPEVTSVDGELDVRRFRTDFSKISEVKFPSLIGPLNEKLICKIKCIDGSWVGPLCSTSEDGRFQPILRECTYKNDHPLLSIALQNSSIVVQNTTDFPHGSVLVARCASFGLYKLQGDSVLRCDNGHWTPKFPECVPTTLVTNFTGDAPPSILYSLTAGSAAVAASGALCVYPDSSLRVDCVTRRALGQPEWTWTQALGQHSVGWSDASEQDTRYRLTLTKMSARHSDNYTCTTAGGHTNTITIRVVTASCPLPPPPAGALAAHGEGSRLGHAVRYSCAAGRRLRGASVLVCMPDGKWSSPPPTCDEITCPQHKALSPHLTLSEYNASFGGRAVFQCAWGYRLVGRPGLECEADGQWSGEVPRCLSIYCPKPLIPENGRVAIAASKQKEKYPVGDLMAYTCDAGYSVVGESTIVCTENGFWSHPPPFCILPADIKKPDTIYLENTTLVYVDNEE